LGGIELWFSLETSFKQTVYMLFSSQSNLKILKSELSGQRANTWLLGLVIAGIVISLFPFFLFTFFTVPYSDDFAFANQSQAGFFHFSHNLYMYASGRYTVIITAYWFNPLRLGLAYGSIGVKFISFAFLVCFLWTLYYLVCVVFSNISKVYALLLAFITQIFFLNSLVGLDEWVYWFVGLNAYFLPMLILLLCYLYLIKYLQQGYLSKVEWVLLHFLNFSVMGTHEIIAVFHLSVLCFIALHIHLNRNQWQISVFSLLIGASLGMFILIVAPGNYARWFNLDQIFAEDVGRYSNQSLLKVSILGAYFAISSMGNWLSNASFWILTLLFLPLMQDLVVRLHLKNSKFISPVLHAGLILLLFISFHIFALRTNHYGIGRVEALFRFLFYWSLWANIQLWLCFYAEKLEKYKLDSLEVHPHKNLFLGIMSLFLVISIMPSSQNINQAYYEVAFVVPGYQDFIKKRLDLLQSSRGKEGVILRQIPAHLRSQFLLVEDYSKGSNSYIRCTEEYFDIKKIKISPY
jgi:hypothetical protein